MSRFHHHLLAKRKLPVSSSWLRDGVVFVAAWESAAPPPPDQLAAFYALTDKLIHASALHRHSRWAELSARAALKAEALLGDDSLVVAHLRNNESKAIMAMAASAREAEQDTLLLRSWTWPARE